MSTLRDADPEEGLLERGSCGGEVDRVGPRTAFERLLSHNEKALIIWAHAGISRRIVIADHTDILRRLLHQYANLSIDLSWVIFEQEIAPSGTLDRRWVKLIEEYPGRFTIGSDTGDFSAQYAAIVQRTYVLLDALTPETARKVAHDNFLALLPRRGLRAQSGDRPPP